MRKLLVIAIVLVAVSALPLSAVTLKGKVVDNKGKPVAGARVILSVDFATDRSFRADETGEFVLFTGRNLDGTVFGYTSKVIGSDGKPAPRATMIAPDGPNQPPSVSVTNAVGTFIYDVPEESKNVYRVLDAAGAPMPHAKVWLSSMKSTRKSEMVMDDKGEYSLKKGQEPVTRQKKQVFVRVVAAGYTYATEYFTATDKQIMVRLQPDRPLKARVVGEDGSPLQGAKVTLLYASAGDEFGRAFSFGPESDRSPVAVTTGKDGAFTLCHLPGGRNARSAQVTLRLDGRGRSRIERIYRVEGLAKSGKIVLPRECIVQGTLYPPGKVGALPERLLLRMTLKENGALDQPSYHDADIGKDGKFRFDKLPPGKALIILWAYRTRPLNWVMPAVQNLVISPSEVKNLELVGTTGALISGVVRDKTTGNPIPRAFLNVQHPGNPQGENALTDKDGKFTIRVAPGKVSMYVESIFNGDKPVRYEENDRSVVTVEVADGQDKSGVDLSVGPPKKPESEQRESGQESEIGRIPDDFELRQGAYDLTWNPGYDISDFPGFGVEPKSPEAKKLARKAPSFVSSKPMYLAFRIDSAKDDGLLLMALDESQGARTGYDVAYVDLNRNFDLTDDEPLKYDPDEGMTPWFKLPSRQGSTEGEHTNNPVHLRLSGPSSGAKNISANDFYLDRKGAWTGYVDTNKGKVQFALVDGNANGIYGEQTNLEDWTDCDSASLGDVVFADTTGFGKAVVKDNSPHEIILCETTRLANRLYTIRANTIGNKVAIGPYEGATGQFTVTCGSVQGLNGAIEEQILAGKAGMFDFSDRGDKPVTVPAGKYNLTQFIVKLEAKKPNSCRIIVALRPGTFIEPGKLTAATISGKLSSAISPSRQTLTLKANSSESVEWVTMIGENATLTSPGDQPRARFFGAKGKLVATAKVDYNGCCGSCVIHVPSLKPGPYTMQLTANTMSPLGVVSAKRSVTVVAASSKY
jgi:hypothetical protein